MDLKKGDRVMGIGSGSGGSQNAPSTYTGTVFYADSDKATIERDDRHIGGGMSITGYGNGWEVNKRDDGSWFSDGKQQGELTIIKEGEFMGLKEEFTLLMAKEPNKSFRKAGIINGDDLLTEEGQKVFLSWLLHTKHAEEFKKDVVDDILKNSKK